MVRQFNLINEDGEKLSLMNIENSCLLTGPTGLGFSYSTDYEQLGNTFITSLRKFEQGKINGQVNFLNYKNYKDFVDFVIRSTKLQFEYTVPYKSGAKTFYRDVEIADLSKSEIQPNGVISEQVTFNCKSLWYEKIASQYEISGNSNEVRWDFRFDSYWSGYTVRDLSFINEGHVDSPVEIEIDGECINPAISLYIENQLYQTITINDTIGEYEKLLYGSKEGDFYIKKQLVDGTFVNMFTLDYINFENDNVLRLPPNKDCTIKLTAEEDIQKAIITVYVYYVSV